MSEQKRIWILAGPNGAGKTTFAHAYLRHEADCPDFLNADLIASGLSPFDPDRAALKAGRIMLAEIKLRVAQGQSFAFETTLSGLSYAGQIPRWRNMGYRVSLIFLWLPKVELAISRVKNRVAQGGHHIPEDVIRQRYTRGWHNFQNVYRKLVDEWVIYDNSVSPPAYLDWGSD